jgi:hypothetical protein
MNVEFCILLNLRISIESRVSLPRERHSALSKTATIELTTKTQFPGANKQKSGQIEAQTVEQPANNSCALAAAKIGGF